MEAFRRALARPKLPLVLGVSFLVMTAFASFESMFALFVESRFGFGATTIGYLFAWVGLVLALVQGVLVGRVVPRVGEHRLVPIAILLMAVALVGHAVAPSVPVLMAAMGLLAVGMGFNSPSMLSVVSRLADPADQGSTLGVSQSLGSLARIVGPLWGGLGLRPLRPHGAVLHVGGADARRLRAERSGVPGIRRGVQQQRVA